MYSRGLIKCFRAGSWLRPFAKKYSFTLKDLRLAFRMVSDVIACRAMCRYREFDVPEHDLLLAKDMFMSLIQNLILRFISNTPKIYANSWHSLIHNGTARRTSRLQLRNVFIFLTTSSLIRNLQLQ